MKHRCPICKKPTDSDEHADFPFCSERCRLLDLGAWASEKYVVSDPIFDEEDLLNDGPQTFTLDLDEPNESQH
ncbi:MAG TPA: DNA gyrase inhibitor YacG [Candidatus Acidoferrum sp.]|nr:DNA gyrase inhibitor YacG [Candidatus Acidoferrum sp.]